MENNPWLDIKPDDYDAHMSHPNVAQTQMLSRIMKDQFELLSLDQRSASCIAILGITNGNGLEHVVSCGIGKVVGIDINAAFINECKTRFADIEEKLCLYQLDLVLDAHKAIEILAECDLIIANLLINHIHFDNFQKIIAGLPKDNQTVSCVIQVNPDGVAVSHSGFEHVFDSIVAQREEENEDLIVFMMEQNSFRFINRVAYDLPNGKQFVRLDFTTA